MWYETNESCNRCVSSTCVVAIRLKEKRAHAHEIASHSIRVYAFQRCNVHVCVSSNLFYFYFTFSRIFQCSCDEVFFIKNRMPSADMSYANRLYGAPYVSFCSFSFEIVFFSSYLIFIAFICSNLFLFFRYHRSFLRPNGFFNESCYIVMVIMQISC